MDLRFALRLLRQDPASTLLAVLVMALGIGANTAVFSVVNAVLLKPLAYHAPDRIVALATLWKKDNTLGQVSAPDFYDWHDQSSAFEALAYHKGWEAAVRVGSAVEYSPFAGLTYEFFRVFQVEPLLGRLFTAEEPTPA